MRNYFDDKKNEEIDKPLEKRLSLVPDDKYFEKLANDFEISVDLARQYWMPEFQAMVGKDILSLESRSNYLKKSEPQTRCKINCVRYLINKYYELHPDEVPKEFSNAMSRDKSNKTNNRKIMADNKITTKEQFKDWLNTYLKNAHGDNFDQNIADKMASDLLDKYGDDFGAAIGAAKSGRKNASYASYAVRLNIFNTAAEEVSHSSYYHRLKLIINILDYNHVVTNKYSTHIATEELSDKLVELTDRYIEHLVGSGGSFYTPSPELFGLAAQYYEMPVKDVVEGIIGITNKFYTIVGCSVLGGILEDILEAATLALYKINLEEPAEEITNALIASEEDTGTPTVNPDMEGIDQDDLDYAETYIKKTFAESLDEIYGEPIIRKYDIIVAIKNNEEGSVETIGPFLTEKAARKYIEEATKTNKGKTQEIYSVCKVVNIKDNELEIVDIDTGEVEFFCGDDRSESCNKDFASVKYEEDQYFIKGDWSDGDKGATSGPFKSKVEMQKFIDAKTPKNRSNPSEDYLDDYTRYKIVDVQDKGKLLCLNMETNELESFDRNRDFSH